MMKVAFVAIAAFLALVPAAMALYGRKSPVRVMSESEFRSVVGKVGPSKSCKSQVAIAVRKSIISSENDPLAQIRYQNSDLLQPE